MLVVGTAGFIGFQVYDSAPASAIDMKFATVGTHPRAAALIGTSYDYYGPRLHDMAISNGKLYAGYGDWNGNSDSWGPTEGRVALVPFDLATRTFESQNEVMVGSEAIMNIREINGSLYVPTTDPSIHGSGGYATNKSGSWQVRNVVPDAVHVLDVASMDGNDLWMIGARDNYAPYDGSVGRAIAWRSTDDGNTWSESLSDGSDPGQGYGFERYYWGQSLSGKLFVHASDTVPESTMRSFDGTTQTTYPGIRCQASDHRVITFLNKIICPNSYENDTYHQLMAISSDGTANGINYPTSGYIEDFYVANGYLYALQNDGVIQRTNDLQSWTSLGRWTYPGDDYVTPTSIAVSGDKIYIGDSKSNIYESGTTITTELARSGVETCFEFDGDATITNYFTRENDNPNNPECSKDVVIPDSIDGKPVTAIGEYAFEGKGITSVELSSDLESIGYDAFANNLLTSVTIPNGVTSIESNAFSENRLTSIDLPSSISEIKYRAFAFNELSNVSIPNGVTTIEAFAFQGNKLSSLVIPNSVTSIEFGAFMHNRLSSLTLSSNLAEITELSFAQNRLRQVTIPSSVTYVDPMAFIEQTEMEPFQPESDYDDEQVAGLSAGQVPDTLQQYLASIWYVRLYTQDPSNPHSLTDEAYVELVDETACDGGATADAATNTEGDVHTYGCDDIDYQAACVDPKTAQEGTVAAASSCEGDLTGDGDADDVLNANYGGHLINPAFVVIKSETKSGKELEADRTLTGKTGDTFVEGYMVKDGPALEPSNPEDEETEPFGVGAMAAGEPNTITLSGSYFKVGQTIQVPASYFPGYTLASGSAMVSITLTAAVNAYTFIYELTDPSLIPGTPDTGGGLMLSMSVLLTVVVAFVVVSYLLIKRRNRTN